MPRLGDRIAERLRLAGLSQAELARRVGITQPAINHLIRRGTGSSAHLHKIARELGTTTEYLTGESDDPEPSALPASNVEWRGPPFDLADIVQVAEIDPRFGLGGVFMDEAPAPEMRSFSRTWLRQITSSAPEQLYWARGSGNSMEPTIADGEIVLIDRSRQSLREADLVWAFAWGDVGAIKRLRPMPDGSVKILSDNPAVAPDVAHDEELHIFGRVIAVVKRI